MTIDLVSIGAWAAFDRIVELDGDLERGATVSVRSHPPHQEVFYGDCSINVAAAASALGARAAVATVVGEDFDSCGYREHLETLGVDTSGVIVHPGATSGWNLNISTPNGSNYCISHRDASRFQDTYPPPAELINQARWLVVSEAFGPYTLAAAQLAHQAGASVALNGMVATAGDLASEFLRVLTLPWVGSFTSWLAVRSVPMGDHHAEAIDWALAGAGLTAAVAGLWLGWVVFSPSTTQGADRDRLEIPLLYPLLRQKYYLDHAALGLVWAIRSPMARAVNWVNDYVIDGVVNMVGALCQGLATLVYGGLDQRGIDGVVHGVSMGASGMGGLVRRIQSGRVQQYAGLLVAGLLLLVVVVLFVL